MLVAHSLHRAQEGSHDERQCSHYINGAQYQLADQYTDPSSAGFQNLILRLAKMLGSNSPRIKHFDVKVDGHKGVFIIRSSRLVSAAEAFVLETEDSAH